MTGGTTWFAAIPDCAAATAAAQSLAVGAEHVIPHASGRPWLVGRWRTDELAVVRVGANLAAVIGPCPSPEPALRALVATATGTALPELCRAAGQLPGSHSFVASVDGTVIARGTASGLRRVFHTTVHGVAVAADRARLLAESAGGGPDPGAVAAALLMPAVPYPLDPAALWTAVHAVQPDHFVSIDSSGAARVRRWWRAPEPVVPLAEGATRVRAALRTAVELRTRAGMPISADLSGGVDSTALCFFLAERQPELITMRVGALDAANDDPEWAVRAAGRLAGAEHMIVDPAQAMSAPFDMHVGAAAFGGGEHPVGGVTSIAVLRHVTGLLSGRGSRIHLGGYGGDEVFGVSRAYLRDLLGSQPRLVAAHLPVHRALRRWSWAAVLRALSDRRSLAEWIVDVADGLTDARRPDSGPQLGWGAAVRLPPWATVLATSMVRQRLLALADATEPLAATRAQHRAIMSVWAAAQAARQVSTVLDQGGLTLAAPYLDDAVLEAALAVALAERGTPKRYKAVLAEAARPVLPAELCGRSTKGFFVAEGLNGLRRHLRFLVELCDDLALARLGLVDADGLRAACLGLDPGGRVSMAVERTVAVELWLRAVSSAPG
ncbi:asparagine synthase-related protein [Micromonospora sp. FIMYZ51]|uniref:asparagine synthase-related protein n=1 Tax=Micromonospora sp. FIMYZ51 TaxID=3051832 RepID=UPI00311EB12A